MLYELLINRLNNLFSRAQALNTLMGANAFCDQHARKKISKQDNIEERLISVSI